MYSRLKRYKPFRKVSDKGLLRKKSQSDQLESDWDFYLDIWQARGGYCQVTGRELGLPLNTMFHHILPKSKFPQYRYCPWNIVILDPVVHATLEQDLDKVPQVKMMYLDLLERHYSRDLPP